MIKCRRNSTFTFTNARLYLFLFFSFVFSIASTSITHAFDFKGNANLSGLYQTDDIASTTVAVVYTADTSTFLGVVVGKDIAIECSKTNRRCVLRQIGDGGELKLEDYKTGVGVPLGNIGGDSLLMTLGLNAKAHQNEWSAIINGNLSHLFLDNRALFGRDKNRFYFYDLYGQYQKSTYQISAGRKSIQAGVLIDGVQADYFFGPEGAKENKSLGLFAGYAPNPIDKKPSKDYFTFGPTFHFVPEFSNSATSTRLLVESSLVTELYKGDMNRFYLFSRVHFTPVKEFSVFSYSTVDLPWTSSHSNFKSSHFSLQTFWRPQDTWFLNFGFSQFQIDRFLQEQAVRWVTDNASQSTRVSDSLDKSQRYRFDFRAAYRPIFEVQPFVRARYERRTFDSNKTYQNSISPASPSIDLALLNRKNAYSGTGGVRLFLWERFESETSMTYSQRFQSSGWDAYQFFSYDSSKRWSLDSSFQLVSSSRIIDNSTPGTAGTTDHSYDFYAGLGGTYRFLSDFMIQIRYDFSNENEKVLDRRTTVHTVFSRLNYKF